MRQIILKSVARDLVTNKLDLLVYFGPRSTKLTMEWQHKEFCVQNDRKINTQYYIHVKGISYSSTIEQNLFVHKMLLAEDVLITKGTERGIQYSPNYLLSVQSFF